MVHKMTSFANICFNNTDDSMGINLVQFVNVITILLKQLNLVFCMKVNSWMSYGDLGRMRGDKLV